MADDLNKPIEDNIDSTATGHAQIDAALERDRQRAARAKLNATAMQDVAPEQAGNAIRIGKQLGIPPMLALDPQASSVYNKGVFDMALEEDSRDFPAMIDFIGRDPVTFASTKDDLDNIREMERAARDREQGGTITAFSRRVRASVGVYAASQVFERVNEKPDAPIRPVTPNEDFGGELNRDLAAKQVARQILDARIRRLGDTARDTRLDKATQEAAQYFDRGEDAKGWGRILETLTDWDEFAGVVTMLAESQAVGAAGAVIEAAATVEDPTKGASAAAAVAASRVPFVKTAWDKLGDKWRKRVAAGTAAGVSSGVMTYTGAFPSYVVEGWNDPKIAELPPQERARAAVEFGRTKAAAEGGVNAGITSLGGLVPGGIVARRAGQGVASMAAGGAGAAAANLSVGQEVDMTDVAMETAFEGPGAVDDVAAAEWAERKAEAYNNRIKQDIERANSMQQTLTRLVNSAANSATRERAPGTLAQFVDMAVEYHGTVPRELGIGARHILEAVGEEGIAQLRTQSETFDQQIDEALANDGEIVMPTGELVEWSAGLTPEQQKVITQNVREHAGAMSMAEAEEAKAELDKFNQEAAALQENDTADEIAAGNEIFETVYNDLVQASRDRSAVSRVEPTTTAPVEHSIYDPMLGANERTANRGEAGFLYRVVSQEEADDIVAHGSVRSRANVDNGKGNRKYWTRGVGSNGKVLPLNPAASKVWIRVPEGAVGGVIRAASVEVLGPAGFGPIAPTTRATPARFGHITDDTNKKYATLFKHAMVTLAKRTGKSPRELFARFYGGIGATEDASPARTKVDAKRPVPKTGERISVDVAHGSQNDPGEFANFDAAVTAGAPFFTDSDALAGKFGKVNKRRVTMNNPLVITQDDLEAILTEDDADNGVLPRDFVPDFVEKAKAGGHDGLIIKNFEDHNITSTIYLPFSAEQISRETGVAQEGNQDGRDRETRGTTIERSVIPSFGTRVTPAERPGAISVVGVHYGQAGLTELDPTKHGTGAKGRERGRTMHAEDERLRSRVFFYVDDGAGINPEDIVTGGARANYAVELHNLYDEALDPLDLYGKAGKDANTFETLVLDAGFSGYYSREAMRNRGGVAGVAVVLGPTPVPATSSFQYDQIPTAQKVRRTRIDDLADDFYKAVENRAAMASRPGWGRHLSEARPDLFEEASALGVFDGPEDGRVYPDAIREEIRDNKYTEDFIADPYEEEYESPADPSKFEQRKPSKAAALADEIAGLQKVIKHLTPAEVEKLRRDTAQKLVDIFNSLPSPDEMAAVAHAGSAKRGWYEQSARAISSVFGPDAPRFTALLAATSPQTSVENNLVNALNIWKNWLAAGRPTDREAIIQVMGRSVMGGKGVDSVLDAWINNSVRALSSEDTDAVVLSGPKVNSFMLNLLGVVEEVTNDAWMANFALVDQTLFSGSLNAAGTDPGKGPGYMAFSARVRAAAAVLTKRTGETWTPAEVQETVWSWAKTLYEMRTSEGETRRAHELLSELTDDLINATPDFGSLFNHERYKEILREAGYEEQLGRLADESAAAAEGRRAQGQTAPFATDVAEKHLTRAAKRLEKLRKLRLDASAEKVKAATKLGQVEPIDTTAENFKKWFGNSKVVDADGKPLVVYHGTAGEVPIGVFRGARGVAAHFAFDKSVAEDFARMRKQQFGEDDASAAESVYPTYVKAERIFDIRREDHRKLVGINYQQDLNYVELEDNADAIQAEGFDSYYDFESNIYAPPTGVAVFRPEQIKSVFNRGTYNANDPDILNQLEIEPLPGAPQVKGATGPDPALVAVAEQYARDNGIPFERQREYVEIDEARAKRIADAYEQMKHDPQNPAVREAYENLIRQTRAQYDALIAAGFRFTFFDSKTDPYAGNPWDAMRDLRATKHMAVYGTYDGFGSDATFDPANNPLLAETGLEWPDQNGVMHKVLANDMFRAVHDAFGHGLEGAGFRAQGEENAWQAHAALFTGSALAALTTETRGQNSWLNYGPHGEKNRTAAVEDTVFADQKTGLMPEWTWNDGRLGSDTKLMQFEQGDLLAQEPKQQPRGKKRGSFDVRTFRMAIIDPNKSTTLHEMGHFFFEMMLHLAAEPDAPKQIVDDINAMLKFIGFEGSAADYLKVPVPQRAKGHEMMAEHFEAYLRTGKAPTIELQGLFRSFARFLIEVYGAMQKMIGVGKLGNVEMDDELRAIFDRMIATDEAIEQSAKIRGLMPQFESAEQAGMTEEEFADYQARVADTVDGAEETLRTRMMRDMKWLSKLRAATLRDLTAEAKAKRKAVRDEVTAEVDRMRVYRLQHFLKRGVLLDANGEPVQDTVTLGVTKLNKAALAAMYPNGEVDLSVFGFGKYGMTAVDGVDPGVVAGLFGYGSADEMVRDIVNAEPRASLIDGLTEQRMLERHADVATPEDLQRAADEAIASEAHTRMVATELRALDARQGSIAALRKAAKYAAMGLIGRRTLRNTRPDLSAAAATRSRKDSAKALAAGKRDEAAAAKRNELLHVEMERQGRAVLKERDAFLRLAAKIWKGNAEAVSKNRDVDLVVAARMVLGRYGIGSPGGMANAARYADMLAKYGGPHTQQVQQMTANLPTPKAYQDLTVDEFNQVVDIASGLYEMAKAEKTVTIDGQKVLIDDIATRIVTSIEGMHGGQLPIPPGTSRTPTKADERLDALQSLRANLTRVETWANLMGDVFVETLLNPVLEAITKYRTRRNRMVKAYKELVDTIAPTLTFKPISAPELKDQRGQPFVFSAGKSEVLHAILHTGNESNKRKLLLGRGWATENPDGTLNTAQWDAFVARMIDEGTLTKADYDFAQAVWDLLETMKPDAQAAHKAVYGFYFNEITANEFVTPFGVYRGGYVPAVADPRDVTEAETKKDAEELLQSGNSFAFPSTNRGFTKSRVEYNRPLELDLRTLASHIDKVCRFTDVQPAVRDTAKLLTNKRISNALNRHDKKAITNILIPWLQVAANQTTTKPGVDRRFDKLISTIDSRTGMGIMFASVINTLQQITGFSLAVVKTNPQGRRLMTAPQAMRSLAAYLRSPSEYSALAHSRSEWLRDRASNQSMELRGAIEDMLVNPSVVEKAERFFARNAYFLQVGLQNVMDPILFNAAYDAAIARGASPAQARRAGEELIRTTQGSFAAEDVSRVEINTPLVRSMLKFYGYFNMWGNLLGSEANKALREAGYAEPTKRLLFLYFAGLAIPAYVAALIAGGLPDDEDDEDGDGLVDEYLAQFFGAQGRSMTAMIPGVGPVSNLVVNLHNEKPYDDRLNVSPLFSTTESAVRSADNLLRGEYLDDEVTKREVRDMSTLISLAVGIPTGPLARMYGYEKDVEAGKIEERGAVGTVWGYATGK